MAGEGKGIAAAAIGAGALLLFAAITGKDIPAALRDVITGKSPASAPVSEPITGATVTSSSSPGSATAQAPSGPGKTAWIVAFLAALGALPTAANVSSMSAWIAHEAPANWTEPVYGAAVTHNPLNTKLQTSAVNGTIPTTSVPTYSSAAAGISATVQTLLGAGAGYPELVAALRSGKGICGQFQGLSTWSSGSYSSVC